MEVVQVVLGCALVIAGVAYFVGGERIVREAHRAWLPYAGAVLIVAGLPQVFLGVA